MCILNTHTWSVQWEVVACKLTQAKYQAVPIIKLVKKFELESEN